MHGTITSDSDRKLEELALFVALKCERDLRFGATKLNKVLYFADMLYYAQNGESITGAEYRRLQFGPAPRRIERAVERLEKEGRAKRITRTTPSGMQQERLVALADPDLDLFSPQEIDFVNEVLRMVDGQNASDLTEATHRHATWRFALDLETINPNAVFISDETITSDERAVLLDDARKHGLL